MNFARKIEEKNPEALIELIRVLLKPIQVNEFLRVIESKSDLLPRLSCDFFMKEINQYTNKIKQNNKDFLINLNKDPVLPSPWHKERYVKCLSYIGEDKKNPYFGGKWTQDDNHRINIFLPWGIVIVNGGNHSISTGIICGEGTLVPTEVYDLSSLLNEVKTDGENYILIKNNQILDSVYDVRTAAVFEIGRLLQKHNIIPMHI